MPSEKLSEDTFLTREQAAHEIGVSVRTLNRRHAEGSGPPRIKHGRKVAYRLSQLHKWLIDHEHAGVRTP